MTPEPPAFALTFPSTFSVMDDVTEQVQRYLDARGVDADLGFRAALVTSEAVTNAIEHGNRLDPAKTVTLRLGVTPAGDVRVEVTDEGEGFDPDLAPRADVADVAAEGGRGLTLMYELADAVRFADGGRTCELEVRPRP